MVRVGVLFGGPSREREVSFAGGRTVYDNLDRSLFEPVPIFVDEWGRFIRLHWQHLYKGSIRDFYPPLNYTGTSFYADSCKKPIWLKEVGDLLLVEELKQHIDIAFLVLHGPRGEDGSIQGLLAWQGIPYVGAGIYAAALGMDKVQQRKLMEAAHFPLPTYAVVARKNWLIAANREKLLDELQTTFSGQRCVIKPANEGSSIGVQVLDSAARSALRAALFAAFFIEEVSLAYWQALTTEERRQYVDSICDLCKGPGLPLCIDNKQLNTADTVLQACEKAAKTAQSCNKKHFYLHGEHTEHTVLVEAFISGREFSCILLENETGSPIVLPPTEIQRHKGCYDYRAKYLPGIVRKHTPMSLTTAAWRKIEKACKKLYLLLNCDVYARLDGFLTPSGEVLLNDPNTTSGMLPSSFLFHQAAEVGLSPMALLSYLVHRSLQRCDAYEKQPNQYNALLVKLENRLKNRATATQKKRKVAILTGGTSTERHIAIESARNVYEKLASSTTYLPIPIFLAGNKATDPLYKLPLPLLLKDNADDIMQALQSTPTQSDWLQSIHQACAPIRTRYGTTWSAAAEPTNYKQLAKEVDIVFLALHGRPGEDGSVQEQLQAVGLPYNGSPPHSAALTINKYTTNQQLQAAGVCTTKQLLIKKETYLKKKSSMWQQAEERFTYPMVAKPVDEGCSAAVCKLYTQKDLMAYAMATFEEPSPAHTEALQQLKVADTSSFSQKDVFLLEQCVEAAGAARFLEVSIGLLSNLQDDKHATYEVFPPSEVLVRSEILSLEEKFLAGEGKNITPALFSETPKIHNTITEKVQATIAQVAHILDLQGYARIDAFVRIHNQQPEVIIIEVNALPGLTPATCLFHQAALAGYTPYALLVAIITHALQRDTQSTAR